MWRKVFGRKRPRSSLIFVSKRFSKVVGWVASGAGRSYNCAAAVKAFAKKHLALLAAISVAGAIGCNDETPRPRGDAAADTLAVTNEEIAVVTAAKEEQFNLMVLDAPAVIEVPVDRDAPAPAPELKPAPETIPAPIPVAKSEYSLPRKWPLRKRMIFEYHAVGGGRTASAVQKLDVFNRAEMKIVYALTLLPGEFGGHEGVMEIRELILRITEKDREKLNFDSRLTAETRSVTVKALRTVIGSKFLYSWNENGTLLKVIGIKALSERLSEMVPDAMWKSLSGYFSEETLSKLMVIHRGLPDRPKMVGETWSEHEKIRVLSAGLGCSLQQQFTLVGPVAGQFEIAQKGAVQYRAISPDAFRYFIGGGDESNGKVWYEPGLGIVTRAEGSNEFNLGTRTKNGIETRFKLTEVYRFKLLQVEPLTGGG